MYHFKDPYDRMHPVSPEKTTHQRMNSVNRIALVEERDNGAASTFVLQYFLRTDDLVSVRGQDSTGNKHYWLMDRVKGTQLNPSNRYSPHELAKICESGKVVGYSGSQSKPAAKFFDLMEKVDPFSGSIPGRGVDYFGKQGGINLVQREVVYGVILAQNGVFG